MELNTLLQREKQPGGPSEGVARWIDRKKWEANSLQISDTRDGWHTYLELAE